MVKLKDILLETKFRYLVEASKKEKAKAEREKILKQKIKYKDKDGNEQTTSVETAYNDKKHPAHKQAKEKLATDKKKTTGGPEKVKGQQMFDKKPKSKKAQDKAKKAADKKEKKELEKIQKAKVVVKEPGKADKEISIKDILPPPFGNADPEKEHPQADDAKQKVYDLYKDRYTKEGEKEIKKRMENTDKKGNPILSKEEQALYDKEVKDAEEFNKRYKKEIETGEREERDIPDKKDWLTEKIEEEYEKKSDYFDPEGPDYGNKNNFWSKQASGEEDDFFGGWDEDDDDDFDWDDDKKDTDDYGKKLSKRGDKKQKKALEMKMRLGVGNTTKVSKKTTHTVTDKDGNPTAVAVFKDDKTGKYYGIDDEGNIYENDTDDFTKMTEPTANARGFDGAVTKRGQSKINTREGRPEDDEDEYDKTTFADLLGMLGIETDIDWTNPFGSD